MIARRAGGAILAASLLVGCARARPAASGPTDGAATPVASTAGTADTLRGIVRRVGSEPNTSLTLERAGAATVPLLSRSPDPLEAAEGLEVMVAGAWGEAHRPDATPTVAREFLVNSFLVRGVDGEPAVDGLLLLEGSRFRLLLIDGRRLELPALPDGLQGRAGARVYLAGPLAEPLSYGILRQPPER